MTVLSPTPQNQVRRHRNTARLITAVLACMVVCLGMLASPTVPAAHAIAATDFKPGNIISDSKFYAGNDFTAEQIQTFLIQQIPRCTLGDAGRQPGSSYGSTTLAKSCLRDYRGSTSSRAANAYCTAYTGSSNESAAQIIAKVARACSISPKVLLVLLEKEQSLVSDTWPTERQYSFAMGYNCPDSGPNNSANCSSGDSGFYQQVYRAAWQFQVYKAHPTSYRYRAHANNQIQWNPNAGCGSSNVYIENSATAGLYIYTPYQPNQAALNAGWGLGDSCSAYGNRNFFLLYYKWFGTPTNLSHAHVDAVTGVYGGIQVSGWARHLDTAKQTQPAWMWTNVFNASGAQVSSTAIQANQNLSWFNTMFPGWGNAHGFQAKIAVPPGTYTVKLYNSSVNSELVSTTTVSVPVGQGHVDSVTSAVGGLRVQGWSVDFRTAAPDTIRLAVNGKTLETSYSANLTKGWIASMFPGSGAEHGFDFVIPLGPGSHQVCVYGAVGLLSPCVSAQFSPSNHGSFDTATPTESGARLTGWAVNTRSSDPVSVSYTVNGGAAKTATANTPLNWFNAYWPGAGSQHGFEIEVPLANSGSHTICVSITAGGTSLGCKTVTVRTGSGISFDSAVGTPGTITATGWAAKFGSPATQYVWINVDGVGSAVKADQPLSWFNSYAPGSGNNHGFAASFPASPGPHEVCVFNASTAALVKCLTAVVPLTEQGHVDTVTNAGAAGIHLTGWAHILGQASPSYIWVDVDGVGSAHKAGNTLSWFNLMFPGQGNDHGFDVTVPAAPGQRNVCVYNAATATALGCTKVTVG